MFVRTRPLWRNGFLLYVGCTYFALAGLAVLRFMDWKEAFNDIERLRCMKSEIASCCLSIRPGVLARDV